jgi:hypothetical protein
MIRVSIETHFSAMDGGFLYERKKPISDKVLFLLTLTYTNYPTTINWILLGSFGVFFLISFARHRICEVT